jgi:hypothetical protein
MAEPMNPRQYEWLDLLPQNGLTSNGQKSGFFD